MKQGLEAEEFVSRFLEKSHCKILARNYTMRGGEIDIIAENRQYILFVEVKQRSEGSWVSAEQAVTMAKRQRLIRTAESFLQRYQSDRQPRFDVACVSVKNGKMYMENYYKNAFDGSGDIL